MPKCATRSENTCDAWGHVTGESVFTETGSPPLAGCDCDLWGHPISPSRLPYGKTTIVTRAGQPMDNPNAVVTEQGINGNHRLKMETQIYSSINAGRFAPNPEQIREAAADLYHACKLVLDPNRSGYSLFSHRATIILEAAVAKAEGRR